MLADVSYIHLLSNISVLMSPGVVPQAPKDHLQTKNLLVPIDSVALFAIGKGSPTTESLPTALSLVGHRQDILICQHFVGALRFALKPSKHVGSPQKKKKKQKLQMDPALPVWILTSIDTRNISSCCCRHGSASRCCSSIWFCTHC